MKARVIALVCASAFGCGDGPAGGHGFGGAGNGGSSAGPPALAGAGGSSGTTAGGAGNAAGAAGESAQGGGAGRAGAPAVGGQGGGAGASPKPGGLGPRAPRFTGRFTEESQGPRFAWSGSSIELRFVGDAVSVTLEDWGHNQFEIILDGQHELLQVEAGVRTYELGQDLGPGEHELTLYRRTEAFFGPTRFLGFSVPDSDVLPSYLPPARRLEIIGDSTCTGYGVEGPDQYCPFGPETENHYRSFAAIAGRTLGAEVHTLGWSGIGVYRDVDGNLGNTFPSLYERALPTEIDAPWDFTRFEPHAVVVNLGSNDFVADDPGLPFEQAYVSFLEAIRVHYPGAQIYCAIGTSVIGSEYSILKPRLQSIIDARKEQGDQRVALLDFGTTDYGASYACDWHPSAETHARMAGVLVDRLRQDLAW